MTTTSLSNRRVAIFEDNVRNRGRWADMVKRSGGIPVPMTDHAPPLKDLGKYFKKEKISLMMSDHRLSEHTDYAGYSGAEAVAESYHRRVGGILVTAYARADAELSLRHYRRWIPNLIHSTDLTRMKLVPALLLADLEVRENKPSKERIPHRAIMTVRSIESRGMNQIVKVIMSQWSVTEEVGFPLEMVPENIRNEVTPGNLLIAQVNIESARAEDIYFDKFELPDPNVLKNANTLFNRS
jgi:hypothetical protein